MGAWWGALCACACHGPHGSCFLSHDHGAMSVRRSPAYLACVDVFFPTSACLIALVVVVGRRVLGSCHTAWYVTLHMVAVSGRYFAEPRRQRRRGVCISGSSFDGHVSGQRHDLWCVAFCRGAWCMGEAESCAERPSAGRHRPHIAGKTPPHGYRVRGGMMC